jgi:hypothetical protein
MRKLINEIAGLSFLLVFSAILCSCGNNDPVTPITGNPQDEYVKVAVAERGNLRFEIWNSSGDTLMTGYNKAGFKVFENNVPKTSGYVKFFAKMYHSGSNSIHSTPVEPQFNYDPALEMFTGYIIMLMPADSTSPWYGFYNYNDTQYVDSVLFDAAWNHQAKFKIFVDLSTSLSYLITVLPPLQPGRGINDFKCMLHESYDFVYFTQVNTANMYIRPWLDSLHHTSTGNVDPVYTSGGIYKGTMNLDYPGLWQVYDSIYYNNKWITPSGNTPYIVFQVQ